MCAPCWVHARAWQEWELHPSWVMTGHVLMSEKVCFVPMRGWHWGAVRRPRLPCQETASAAVIYTQFKPSPWLRGTAGDGGAVCCCGDSPSESWEHQAPRSAAGGALACVWFEHEIPECARPCACVHVESLSVQGCGPVCGRGNRILACRRLAVPMTWVEEVPGEEGVLRCPPL